jgi:hypothetical protein
MLRESMPPWLLELIFVNNTPWLICEKETVYYIAKMTVSGSLDYVQLYKFFCIFRELGRGSCTSLQLLDKPI